MRVRDVGCGEVSKRGRGLRVIPLLMTSDILQHDEMIRVARWSNTSTCVCVCVCVYSLSLFRENHQRRLSNDIIGMSANETQIFSTK